jgi:hypothetical protein
MSIQVQLCKAIVQGHEENGTKVSYGIRTAKRQRVATAGMKNSSWRATMMGS